MEHKLTLTDYNTKQTFEVNLQDILGVDQKFASDGTEFSVVTVGNKPYVVTATASFIEKAIEGFKSK